MNVLKCALIIIITRSENSGTCAEFCQELQQEENGPGTDINQH